MPNSASNVEMKFSGKWGIVGNAVVDEPRLSVDISAGGSVCFSCVAVGTLATMSEDDDDAPLAIVGDFVGPVGVDVDGCLRAAFESKAQAIEAWKRGSE